MQLRIIPKKGTGQRTGSQADALRARGVTHITVNCAFYRGGCDTLLPVLDRLPFLRKTAEGRWMDEPVRLYELRR